MVKLETICARQNVDIFILKNALIKGENSAISPHRYLLYTLHKIDVNEKKSFTFHKMSISTFNQVEFKTTKNFVRHTLISLLLKYPYIL